MGCKNIRCYVAVYSLNILKFQVVITGRSVFLGISDVESGEIKLPCRYRSKKVARKSISSRKVRSKPTAVESKNHLQRKKKRQKSAEQRYIL